jgi:hypothetical protein
MEVWAPLAVSLAALVFAVASFWWTHWRRGKLTVSTPRQFAAYLGEDKSMLLLPLGLWNSGPVPYLITDLRLQAPHDDRWWTWVRTRTEVQPSHDPTGSMAAPFVVPGRVAAVVFAEFQVRPGVAPAPAGWRVRIEARFGHRPGWTPLATVPVVISEKVVAAAGFIAFSNDAE